MSVTAQDVSAWSERESLYFLIGTAFRSARQRIATYLFLPFLFLAVLGLAQCYPWTMRRMLNDVRPALPHVEDVEALTFLRDALRLALSVGRFYAHFCVFTSAMNDVLDETDETIDSISFVLNNRKDLDAFVEECEMCSSPDLPLALPVPEEKIAATA
jgi:hypothetical protein